MARPWQKPSGWPYARRDGTKSWRLGYRDHEGRTRSKAFPSSHAARAWMRDYIEAERRGKDTLMRFLLDLDAKERNAEEAGLLIGEVVQLYLAHNEPSQEEGLAPATYKQYRLIAERQLLGHPGWTRDHQRELPPHGHAQRLALTPASALNEPQVARVLWDEMLRAKVARSARHRARLVLSAVAAWAATTSLVPEVHTNGVLLANEQRLSRRRSARRGGAGVTWRGRRRHGAEAASWALSALAVEHIRADQLRAQGNGRPPLLAERDAMATGLQFGLSCRNQEVWGLRWGGVAGGRMHIEEVVSWGLLDEGKTYGSTPRTTRMPGLLVEDLERWRELLAGHGVAVRDCDFIIPGDLAGARYGLREAPDDGCHLTRAQAAQWGPKRFRPAVRSVAASVPGLSDIAAATPYSLRRGGITARLRSEDSQVVARECGTSLEMLDKHYSFALEDYKDKGPQPFDEAWREARTRASAQVTARTPTKAPAEARA